MNPEDFHAPQAGKVIRTPRGYFAFIPAPLPPDLIYDDRLVVALSQADAALSELSGSGRHLPNPHLLLTLYIPGSCSFLQDRRHEGRSFRFVAGGCRIRGKTHRNSGYPGGQKLPYHFLELIVSGSLASGAYELVWRS